MDWMPKKRWEVRSFVPTKQTRFSPGIRFDSICLNGVMGKPDYDNNASVWNEQVYHYCSLVQQRVEFYLGDVFLAINKQC